MSQGSMNRRVAERVPISVIGIEVGSVCGIGRIYDVSVTGLRIEGSGMVPPIGEVTRLTFVLTVEQPAFEIEGKVVRHTDTGGFAVTFAGIDPRLRDLIEALSDRVKELPDIEQRKDAIS